MEEKSALLIQDATNQATSLMTCLAEKSNSVQNKYNYYNADNTVGDLGISTPKKLTSLQPGIGWASRAVNTLSDRVVFEGFANDTFGINDYFDDINAFSTISKSKHDAFIAGCAFIAISDEGDRKMLVPFTAQEATGILNQTTGLLDAGLAVTKWSPPAKKGTNTPLFTPCDYVVYTKEYTAIFINRTLVEIVANPTGRCLLHPITHRSSADRPLGKSRLTNTARRIIREVARQKRREEIAEEFYSIPQRYMNGIAQGATKDDSLDSAIGKLWAITVDDDGDKPEIGQLPQMSINQFETAKKDKARDFCAETALTLRNLGYETSNPSSPESLAAMSDDLLLEATNSQSEMGEQIKQLAITLRLALNGSDQIADDLNNIIPAWKPIFKVDIGAAGDAMFKLFEIMPELRGTVAGYRMLGMSIREAEELSERRQRDNANNFMNQGGS